MFCEEVLLCWSIPACNLQKHYSIYKELLSIQWEAAFLPIRIGNKLFEQRPAYRQLVSELNHYPVLKIWFYLHNSNKLTSDFKMVDKLSLVYSKAQIDIDF